MEFIIRGKQLDISDELIEKYLQNTDVSRKTLDQMIDLHFRRAKNNPSSYGIDINKAVENSIKSELALWNKDY